jgi:hypothetical protein
MRIHPQSHFEVNESTYQIAAKSIPYLFNMAMIRPTRVYPPLAVVSRARKTLPLRVSTTEALHIAQIPVVSSKEGAVIGALLGTRKFHRGHH